MIIQERATETHLYFLRGVFSNFAYSPFILDGIKWQNCEAAFMYYKAIHFKDLETAEKIKKETNPRKAKALGRLVKNYDDTEWNKVRYSYMLKVNMAKYETNLLFLNILLNTGNKTLVECNFRDKIWSCGLDASNDAVLDKSKWTGQNLLGEVLMEIRTHFVKMKGTRK